MPIVFTYQKKADFPDKRLLKKFIAQIITNHNKTPNIFFIFCSDAFLLKINNKFLRHNYYTDILTFDLSQSTQSLDADIYISIDMIKYNAKMYHIALNEEVKRVMFHGILHLLQYSDKKEKQKEIMRKMENKLLKDFKNFVSRETN